ncbi:MAG: SAM-dependent methyltransferase, partial [Pseudomonadota bacterium]|nr:SAM-dependent methyltransferase [Pseudomonadota bacterium]
SAPTTALLLSGLPPDRLYFGGFLPPRAGPRQRTLAAVAALDATLIFFESARRLAASLADAGAVLGPRPAAVARELTKRFEEVRRADLATLAAHYATAGPPKGEIVVVIGGADAAAGVASAEEVDAKLTLKLADASLRDAVRQVTAESGWTRADVYARALALRDGDG